MTKISYNKIHNAVKEGMAEFNKHNPENNPKYPIENYIAHSVAYAIEAELSRIFNTKEKCTWEYINFKK